MVKQVILLLLVCSFALLSSASKAASWSYSSQESWPSTCGLGVRQSPIDINFLDQSVVYDKNLGNLKFSGFGPVPSQSMTVANTGSNLVVAVNPNMKLNIGGGNLKTNYDVAQFNFHWGYSNEYGSDHSINGKYFPLEMHITAFAGKSLHGALANPNSDSMAQFAVFFALGKHNPDLQVILDNIKPFGQRSNINLSMNLERLLPVNATSEYLTYGGSLTAPPCTENVKWFVFRNLLTVSPVQLERLRHIIGSDGNALSNTFRGVQNLNNRKVRASFEFVTQRLPYPIPQMTAATEETLKAFSHFVPTAPVTAAVPIHIQGTAPANVNSVTDVSGQFAVKSVPVPTRPSRMPVAMTAADMFHGHCAECVMVNPVIRRRSTNLLETEAASKTEAEDLASVLIEYKAVSSQELDPQAQTEDELISLIEAQADSALNSGSFMEMSAETQDAPKAAVVLDKPINSDVPKRQTLGQAIKHQIVEDKIKDNKHSMNKLSFVDPKSVPKKGTPYKVDFVDAEMYDSGDIYSNNTVAATADEENYNTPTDTSGRPKVDKFTSGTGSRRADYRNDAQARPFPAEFAGANPGAYYQGNSPYTAGPMSYLPNYNAPNPAFRMTAFPSAMPMAGGPMMPMPSSYPSYGVDWMHAMPPRMSMSPSLINTAMMMDGAHTESPAAMYARQMSDMNKSLLEAEHAQSSHMNEFGNSLSELSASAAIAPEQLNHAYRYMNDYLDNFHGRLDKLAKYQTVRLNTQMHQYGGIPSHALNLHALALESAREGSMTRNIEEMSGKYAQLKKLSARVGEMAKDYNNNPLVKFHIELTRERIQERIAKLADTVKQIRILREEESSYNDAKLDRIESEEDFNRKLLSTRGLDNVLSELHDVHDSRMQQAKKLAELHMIKSQLDLDFAPDAADVHHHHHRRHHHHHHHAAAPAAAANATKPTAPAPAAKPDNKKKPNSFIEADAVDSMEALTEDEIQNNDANKIADAVSAELAQSLESDSDAEHEERALGVHQSLDSMVDEFKQEHTALAETSEAIESTNDNMQQMANVHAEAQAAQQQKIVMLELANNKAAVAAEKAKLATLKDNHAKVMAEHTETLEKLKSMHAEQEAAKADVTAMLEQKSQFESDKAALAERSAHVAKQAAAVNRIANQLKRKIAQQALHQARSSQAKAGVSLAETQSTSTSSSKFQKIADMVAKARQSIEQDEDEMDKGIDALEAVQ